MISDFKMISDKFWVRLAIRRLIASHEVRVCNFHDKNQYLQVNTKSARWGTIHSEAGFFMCTFGERQF